MRRFRQRWLAALLGGIVLPFDPCSACDVDGRASGGPAHPCAQSAAVKSTLAGRSAAELGPRSLEAIQLAHRALKEYGAGILAERVADPDYRPGFDGPS